MLSYRELDVKKKNYACVLSPPSHKNIYFWKNSSLWKKNLKKSRRFIFTSYRYPNFLFFEQAISKLGISTEAAPNFWVLQKRLCQTYDEFHFRSLFLSKFFKQFFIVLQRTFPKLCNFCSFVFHTHTTATTYPSPTTILYILVSLLLLSLFLFPLHEYCKNIWPPPPLLPQSLTTRHILSGGLLGVRRAGGRMQKKICDT